MPDDLDVIDDTATDSASADETNADASPVVDPDSPAESAPAEEVDDSPEAVAEREKQARTAKRIADAEAAEKRKAAEREKRRKELEDQDREQRIAAREREANDTLRRANELIADLEKRRDAALKGGYEGLKALGIEYGDWTKKTLEDTSPDALARQAIERADRLEAEIKKRDEDAERARRQAAAEAEAEQVKKNFEGFVDKNADDFPDAALLPGTVLHVLAASVAAELARAGRQPTFAAMLPRLDERAKKIHDEQKQKAAKRSQPGTTPSDGTPNPQASPSGQPASTPANRTLTPAMAGTRATPPRKMTEEEVDEWAAAELRTALAADRKAARSA